MEQYAREMTRRNMEVMNNMSSMMANMFAGTGIRPPFAPRRGLGSGALADGGGGAVNEGSVEESTGGGGGDANAPTSDAEKTAKRSAEEMNVPCFCTHC